ncbi:hypothetical protein AOQ84DRAFT_220353 [Glonium stellatum]|uniref:RBR-type E3 ubiquitin transferase n=1 Tax=Glonium stellatum TaxID=574774 RepID=A0A8E2FCK3_9PEZI|nr:hypothetical protein AOQ84DRAFT_220353 [Glonium stellatum]
MATCVICGDEEKQDAPLRRTACGDHYMCDACLEQTFSLALRDESHYPPRCCDDETSFLMVDEYLEYLPGDVVWNYQIKEIEYSIHSRFRTYCGNPSCARFIHPDQYQHDSLTTAPCNSCTSVTCVKCKALVDSNVAAHECIVPEADRKFEIVVREENYQRCVNCGITIELSEACNHISCDCGTEFCYICGKEWEGIHECPHYGRPEYDEEGYNQDGFHRETRLNREGRTRAEEMENGRFDEDGFDEEGFDRDGFDTDGMDRDGYDQNGFDEHGFDRQGYDAEGLDRDRLPRMSEEDREIARILQMIQDAETGWAQPLDEGGNEDDGQEDEQDDSGDDDSQSQQGDQEVDREETEREQERDIDLGEQADEGNQGEANDRSAATGGDDNIKGRADVDVRDDSVVKDESRSY